MQTEPIPQFLISQMRMLTMPAMTFFYVTNQPTAFANLEADLDPLLESLYEAKTLAHLTGAGPDIVRYYPVKSGGQPGETNLFVMEVGIAVQPGTSPAGKAQIQELPSYACAGILLWGGLTHVGEAYKVLQQTIQAAGLKPAGETREWTYWFEKVDSPNNLMGIYMQVRQES